MISKWILIVLLVAAAEARPVGSDSVLPDGIQGMGWKVPAVGDSVLRERCDRIYLSMEHLARHLLSSVKPWREDSSLLLATESRSKENWIRPNAGIACGLAFLYRFGPYEEQKVGVSRAELLEDRILPMIRYLTQTHVTGSRSTSDGSKWGDAWQSALWARTLGRAAWYLGPDLPADVSQDVRRVVAHEAERIAGSDPPHQIEKDTKAEENAWNCTVLSMAVLLMPDDPRRPRWEQAFQRWALSAFLRPADEHSSQIIDGRPLAEQFTGANIRDDFTLENHGIVHPDYMTSASQLLGCSLDYAMTGRRPPEAIVHNAAGVYENLKWFALPDGGFVYPSGQDWALFRNPDWLSAHVLMAVFGGEQEAWLLADRSLDALERMQARSSSGQIYLKEDNFFASAEADKLHLYAMAWLSLHFAQQPVFADPQRRGVHHLESAKIIMNRTREAVHTVSWGAQIMAQCVPYQLDRIVSPHSRSVIGYIRVDGQDRPLGVRLVDVHVDEGDDGFTVELKVEHGQGLVRSDVMCRSQSDGTWLMRERLTAVRDVKLAEVATGLVGILNNRNWIHEHGKREVRIGAEGTRVAACSGKVLQADGVRELAIDSVLHMASEAPLSVCYRGAAKPDRGRATDELYLNFLDGERAWKAGQTISEFEVVMRCKPAASAPAR